MKFSYNWLKELSGTKKTAEEVAELFLIHSFEVEGIEKQGKGLEDVVVGEVLSVEKHPDADRLNVAQVNVAVQVKSQKSEVKKLQIVCGAPNLKIGQKVPVALVGAVLPCPHSNTLSDGEVDKKGFGIKKSKIRGVESNGMICVEDELGIGAKHDGIMVLPFDAPVGEEFAKYMGLDDTIIDIDILPNRGHDCLSYNGVAREICALENTSFNPKVQSESEILKQVQDDNNLEESIEASIDSSNCARYICVKIDGIEIKESPEWLKMRLKASDMQPINSIIDITNYVMLETGQPLHAFDSDNISKIGVRQATHKEKIVLLDEQELELDSDDVVITDGNNPIALAGVMGGNESAITDDTKNIILEVASFDSIAIRFTQRKYNLQTDAAYRFERDIDPNLAEIAVACAMELLMEFAGGKIIAVTDNYPNPIKPWTVKLSTDKVIKMLGVEIATDEIKSILERLGIQCVKNFLSEENRAMMLCAIPTVRIDLRSQEDLIEEIGRVHGYDKIKPKPLVDVIQTPKRNETRFFERAVKDVFVHGGFDEVRSYSFYSTDDAKVIGLNDEAHITLMNPMNPKQAIMQRTLMPNLLHFAKKNFSYFDHVQIFEIGRIYDPTVKTRLIASLPDEKLVLGAVVASKDSKGSQFFEMKGTVEVLLDRINIGEYYFDTIFDENVQHLPNLHPSRRCIIKMESGKIIGWMGEVDKKTSKYFGLKKNRAVVCELDIEAMLHEMQSENFFEPLAKYPFVSRDLSMMVGDRVYVDDVEKAIYNIGGDLIKDVDLFDVYQNKETGERSMAFHIIFGMDDRTLKTKEVDEKIKLIITRLENEMDIEIRK